MPKYLVIAAELVTLFSPSAELQNLTLDIAQNIKKFQLLILTLFILMDHLSLE
jgi:hypothetical protein